VTKHLRNETHGIMHWLQQLGTAGKITSKWR